MAVRVSAGTRKCPIVSEQAAFSTAVFDCTNAHLSFFFSSLFFLFLSENAPGCGNRAIQARFVIYETVFAEPPSIVYFTVAVNTGHFFLLRQISKLLRLSDTLTRPLSLKLWYDETQLITSQTKKEEILVASDLALGAIF